MLQVESELVDAYARGQLSTEMRERFENSYLKHAARRNRVEFARALTTRIDEKEASATRAEQSSLSLSWKQRLLGPFGQGPALRFAMALILVSVAMAGIWILVKTQWKNQRERIAAQQPSQTPQQPQPPEEQVAQVPPETSRPSPSPTKNSAPSTVSLALTVGGVRSADGGPTQTLLIPREMTQAQILLDLKDDSYPHYRVSLRQIGGAEIFTQTNITPRRTKAGARFVFTMPARQLTSGDYALTLSGITPNGEVDDLNKSLFRVDKP